MATNSSTLDLRTFYKIEKHVWSAVWRKERIVTWSSPLLGVLKFNGWSSPPLGVQELNVDGAARGKLVPAGIGGVLQNCRGKSYLCSPKA